MSKFVAFLRDESGASAAEYVLIIAVVGGALTAILTIFTGAMSDAMNNIKDIINPPPAAP
jgi:pilus assembly protein Flp/PilA